jgi:hypothetical protein
LSNYSEVLVLRSVTFNTVSDNLEGESLLNYLSILALTRFMTLLLYECFYLTYGCGIEELLNKIELVSISLACFFTDFIGIP